MKNSKTIQRKRRMASTQKHLEIAEIKENTLIMKDGSIRVILLASSVNFSLKSTEEQEAIIGEYVSFLNFLDFPLQIVIQSRKLNIDKYLEEIRKKEQAQTNELLRMQTAEYIQYVNELVELGEIMSKRFYIVVPYTPGGEEKENFFARLGKAFAPITAIRMRDKIFQEYRKKIQKRIDRVAGSLQGMGVSAVELDTQSLVELFYNTYNLEIYNQQKLTDLDNVQVDE